MRAYWELPFFSGVVLALPMSLCSIAPDFFKQRDNGVSKWVSIPSSVLGGVWCSRWEWDHSFLLMLRASFQMFSYLLASHWLPAPPGCCTTASPSSRRHHRQLPVPQWLVCPASSICSCHRGLAQVKQWSCGHQVIVRASWCQLRSRQALPSTEHWPIRHLLPFNYNVAEILSIRLHLTSKTYIEIVSTFSPDSVTI